MTIFVMSVLSVLVGFGLGMIHIETQSIKARNKRSR